MNGATFEQADNASVGFFSRLLNKGLDIIPEIINPKSATQTEAQPTPGAKVIAPTPLIKQYMPLIIGGGVVVGLGVAAWLIFRKP